MGYKFGNNLGFVVSPKQFIAREFTEIGEPESVTFIYHRLMKEEDVKLRAILKSGGLCGLGIGLSIHSLVFIVLYQMVFQFEIPELIADKILFLAAFIVLVGIPLIGFLAVCWSGDEVNSWTQGAVTGGWAGLLAGVIGYLFNGALASTIAFGYVPFVEYLTEPSLLQGIDLRELLRSIIGQAIPQIYLSILGYLAFWAIMGALGGGITFVVRSAIKRRNTRKIIAVDKEMVA